MEEPLKRSVLDIINNFQENRICRLIYFAEIKCFEQVLSYFDDYSSNHFFNKISGLLLIYPTMILHLMEAEEEMLYTACLDLTMNKDNGLAMCRCFPIHVNTNGRLFYRWYMKRINCSSNNEEFIQLEDMEKIKEIYFNAVDEFYSFYLHLTKNVSHAKDIKEKLDNLSEENSLVPCQQTIRLLLNIPWGFELSSLTDKYWNNDLADKEDVIWPIDEIQEPSIFPWVIKHSP